MNIDFPTISGVVAGAASIIGGLYTWYRRYTIGLQIKKDKEKQDILSQAKLELSRVEWDLNEKIKVLETELASTKESLSRDLGHLKEVYSAEIKVLGEKIEEIRQTLGQQHGQLVNLLTVLIDKK